MSFLGEMTSTKDRAGKVQDKPGSKEVFTKLGTCYKDTGVTLKGLLLVTSEAV